MTMSHENVYDAKNLPAINSEPCVAGPVNEFTSPLDHAGSHVEFQAQSAEADLDLETGTALGLIVTELLSNCLKHAFPDDRAGKILLALNKINDSTLEVSVSDDRIGLRQKV